MKYNIILICVICLFTSAMSIAQDCEEVKSTVIEFKDMEPEEILFRYKHDIYKLSNCGVDSFFLLISMYGELCKQTISQAKYKQEILKIGDLVPLEMYDLMKMGGDKIDWSMSGMGEAYNAFQEYQKLRVQKVTLSNYRLYKNNLAVTTSNIEDEEIEALISSGKYDNLKFQTLLDDIEEKKFLRN